LGRTAFFTGEEAFVGEAAKEVALEALLAEEAFVDFLDTILGAAFLEDLGADLARF
jgi:hypothetical protein